MFWKAKHSRWRLEDADSLLHLLHRQGRLLPLRIRRKWLLLLPTRWYNDYYLFRIRLIYHELGYIKILDNVPLILSFGNSNTPPWRRGAVSGARSREVEAGSSSRDPVGAGASAEAREAGAAGAGCPSKEAGAAVAVAVGRRCRRAKRKRERERKQSVRLCCERRTAR